MKTSDFEKFREGIEGVYAFYNRPVTPFVLDVWWNALKNFDLPAITDAFNRHLMNPDTGQFLPKPADIVKMFSGTTQDQALIAWAKVDRALRTVGTYRSVVFDDQITQRVLHDMGGWISLGQKQEKEWPFVAREFENRYRAFRIRSEIPDCPPVLVGLEEAYNSINGHRIAPPVLIGDETKARALLERSNPVEATGPVKLSVVVGNSK